ncbi:hypothetical protein WJX81_008055 [Elliptochloris bilobata]|uniref:Meckel syndrome type 1 protein n=1 Tax=Elliptochloris bilobata TaxID=381761 RepID=A0AAW1RBJ8_9CHLO
MPAPGAPQEATGDAGAAAANAPPALGGGFPGGGSQQSLASTAARQTTPAGEQMVVNRNREALLAATGQGSVSLDQARSANAALAKEDAGTLAAASGAPPALQALAGMPAAAPQAPQAANGTAAAGGARPTLFLQTRGTSGGGGAGGGRGGGAAGAAASNASLPQPLSPSAPQDLAELTAQTRPLTSNDLNTLVQGVRAAQSAQQYLATLGDAPTARSGIQGTNLGSLTKSAGGGQLAVGSPSGKVYLAPGASTLPPATAKSIQQLAAALSPAVNGISNDILALIPAPPPPPPPPTVIQVLAPIEQAAAQHVSNAIQDFAATPGTLGAGAAPLPAPGAGVAFWLPPLTVEGYKLPAIAVPELPAPPPPPPGMAPTPVDGVGGPGRPQSFLQARPQQQQGPPGLPGLDANSRLVRAAAPANQGTAEFEAACQLGGSKFKPSGAAMLRPLALVALVACVVFLTSATASSVASSHGRHLRQDEGIPMEGPPRPALPPRPAAPPRPASREARPEGGPQGPLRPPQYEAGAEAGPAQPQAGQDAPLPEPQRPEPPFPRAPIESAPAPEAGPMPEGAPELRRPADLAGPARSFAGSQEAVPPPEPAPLPEPTRPEALPQPPALPEPPHPEALAQPPVLPEPPRPEGAAQPPQVDNTEVVQAGPPQPAQPPTAALSGYRSFAANTHRGLLESASAVVEEVPAELAEPYAAPAPMMASTFAARTTSAGIRGLKQAEAVQPGSDSDPLASLLTGQSLAALLAPQPAEPLAARTASAGIRSLKQATVEEIPAGWADPLAAMLAPEPATSLAGRVTSAGIRGLKQAAGEAAIAEVVLAPAPAPAPDGADAPLQPTGLVLAPAPAIAAAFNGAVDAINAAPRPGAARAAQPPALPALPPQVASFIKGSLETAATTLFSNLASSLQGRRLVQDEASSEEVTLTGPGQQGPPQPEGPGPRRQQAPVYNSFAAARTQAPAAQPRPDGPNPAGPGLLPPLPEPQGAPVRAARPAAAQVQPRPAEPRPQPQPVAAAAQPAFAYAPAVGPEPARVPQRAAQPPSLPALPPQVSAAFRNSFEIAANSFIAQVGHALQGRRLMDDPAPANPAAQPLAAAVPAPAPLPTPIEPVVYAPAIATPARPMAGPLGPPEPLPGGPQGPGGPEGPARPAMTREAAPMAPREVVVQAARPAGPGAAALAPAAVGPQPSQRAVMPALPPQVATAFKQSFEIAANSFIQQVGHALAGRKMLEEAVETL